MSVDGRLLAPARPQSRRWVALTFLLLAVLVVTLNQTVTSVSAPSIVHDLGTSVEIASLATTLYLAIAASFLISAGRLADHIGHKVMAVAALILFAGASAIVAVATQAWVLLVGRCLQGLAFAGVMPSTLAIINMEFPDVRGHQARAIAFGGWATVSGAAIALGPLWGGWWGETRYGWRGAFALNVVITLALLVGVILTVHERHKTPTMRHPAGKQRFDVPGVVFLTIWIATLVVVLEEGQRLGWITSQSSGATAASQGASIVPIVFAASLVAFVAFFFVERRRNRRGEVVVIDRALFRIGTYRNATLAVSFTYFGNFGLLFIVSVYTQFALGFSALASGLTIAAAGLGILVGGQAASWPVHVFGPRRVVIASVFYQPVILLSAIPFISTDIQGRWLAAILLLYGIGWGVSYSAFLNIAYRDVPDDLAAAASGSQLALRVLAGAVGTAVLGSVLSAVVVAGVRTELEARPDISRTEEKQLELSLRRSLYTPFASVGADVGPAFDQLDEPGGPRAGRDPVVTSLYTRAFRIALMVAAGVSFAGVWFAFRIPRAEASKLGAPEKGGDPVV